MTAEKPAQSGEKRSKASSNAEAGEPKAKRGRGRPKGSKNKTKELVAHVSRDQRLSARKATAEKAGKVKDQGKKK